MVEAEASERPMYFILPSSTSFFSSPIYIHKKRIASFFFWFAEDEQVKDGRKRNEP
jgi:hypothetical protein